MLHFWSGNQKLNTKILTEAEIVGVSYYLPYNIQLVIFLEHQGYPILNNIVFQYNQSAINMEKNGRKSCTVNSRYIVVRCFFTKGIIKKGEMVVEYCPTELMMADFFTKDLQGRAFKFFRDIIVGYTNIAEIL